mmetsp:Transcript_1802/g.2399  ORF Transcript_1802/g.2399 Transcript_1802/m.2399 type:complete len:376 (+) Transcript_1802:40-1167(+)
MNEMNNHRDWETGLCDVCYIGRPCCCLAFVPCVGDSLVTAYALAQMESTSSVCFHFMCSPGPMARNYMAAAYGLESKPGLNCCLACCCRCCSAAQMYGHVIISGPIKKTEINSIDFAAHYAGLPRECNDIACFDPCNCVHNTLCLHCVSSSHLVAITGLPAWLCCYTTYCLNHHILRINFGVPGLTYWNDCIEPSLCFSFMFIPGVNVFCGWCCAIYFSQQLENERSIIKYALSNNASRFFLVASDTGGENATTTQPGRAEENSRVSFHPENMHNHLRVSSEVFHPTRRSSQKKNTTEDAARNENDVSTCNNSLQDETTASSSNDKTSSSQQMQECQNDDSSSWLIRLAARFFVPDFDMRAPAYAIPSKKPYEHE